MKRFIAITLMLIIAFCLTPASSDQVRAFTDSTGRVVELPLEIDRIAVSGPLAQIAVFALAPDKLVGIATPWDKSANEYVDAKYYNLPILGQIYGTKGELNLEELLKADPQVVIDVGQSKKTLIEDMDELTEMTGIPFVHISSTLATLGESYALLGELVGMEAQAAVLSRFCENVYSRAESIANSVDKVRLIYLTGHEGLDVIPRGSFHSEIIDMMGENVAVLDTPSTKGLGNTVDMEQLIKWNPDCVIFAPDSVYHSAKTDPVWNEIDAIKNGRFFEAPIGPDNWMGFPPSVNRLMGLIWMAKLLYPEEADYNLYDEIARYYELFYHHELSAEQFDALVANSIGKL